MLDTITDGDYTPEEYDLYEILKDILELPDVIENRLYCMATNDGWKFFSTQEEFKKAYERDWCNYSWEELETDTLAEWCERLFENKEDLFCSY